MHGLHELSIVDQNSLQIFFCRNKPDENYSLGWYVGPRVLVWVEMKGFCLWEHLPKWRDGAISRRTAKVRKLGLTGLCVKPRVVSARLRVTCQGGLGSGCPRMC